MSLITSGFSLPKNITLPITSLSEMIGVKMLIEYLSIFSAKVYFLSSGCFNSYAVLSLKKFSTSLETFRSKISFFGTPETAIITSLSVMQTACPLIFAKISAYCVAKLPSSPMGEYFLKITSPSLSVNISKGSPSHTSLVHR